MSDDAESPRSRHKPGLPHAGSLRTVRTWDAGRRGAAEQAAGFPPTQEPSRPHADSGRRTTRQLNVRLSHGQFAEIERAAALLGLKPRQLARQFILTGAGRVLYEDRRHEQARRRT